MNKFKDSGHLFRLAAVFAAGFILLVVARGFLLPRSFGQYGHFRGDAMHEIAAQQVNYAGHETCEDCHSEVLDVKKNGKHVNVRCESCHGPQARHAEDPGSVKPEKLDAAVLCVRCHEANSAKPRWFRQVVSEEHSSGLSCDMCHQPHSPAIDSDDKKSDDKKSGDKKSGDKNAADKKSGAKNSGAKK
jgi:transcription elongation factor Elf1